jgi:hypothetical protein
MKSVIILDYFQKLKNQQADKINNSLLNLIVEYPKTIYLDKIKYIINEELKTDEK